MTTDEPPDGAGRPVDEPRNGTDGSDDELTNGTDGSTDGPVHGADEADRTESDEPTDEGGIGDRVVDRWLALDRGWQALWLGLAIVVVHQLIGSI